MSLTLRHLRKGKITKISAEVLQSELNKLEARKLKYETTIKENSTMFKVLGERLSENGESTSRWHGRVDGKNDWSEDKLYYHELDDNIRGAENGLKKIAEKRARIETELLDRILIGDIK